MSELCTAPRRTQRIVRRSELQRYEASGTYRRRRARENAETVAALAAVICGLGVALICAVVFS